MTQKRRCRSNRIIIVIIITVVLYSLMYLGELSRKHTAGLALKQHLL